MKNTELPVEEVTTYLRALESGDRSALDKLFPLVYDNLKRLASINRARLKGQETLNTTALVHEAYLRLAKSGNQSYEDRIHFFRVASKAMRQLLVNRARDKSAQKRSGNGPDLSLEDIQVPELPKQLSADLLTLDDLLEELKERNSRQADVVECRFFGGMSVEETASALSISPATVKRDWNFSRAWLFSHMKESA